MFDFRLVDHRFKQGEKIIEIWDGENLMGTIYPMENGIKIVSKFIAENPEAAIQIDKMPPIPAIVINLLKQQLNH